MIQLIIIYLVFGGLVYISAPKYFSNLKVSVPSFKKKEYTEFLLSSYLKLSYTFLVLLLVFTPLNNWFVHFFQEDTSKNIEGFYRDKILLFIRNIDWHIEILLITCCLLAIINMLNWRYGSLVRNYFELQIIENKFPRFLPPTLIEYSEIKSKTHRKSDIIKFILGCIGFLIMLLSLPYTSKYLIQFTSKLENIPVIILLCGITILIYFILIEWLYAIYANYTVKKKIDKVKDVDLDY